MENGSGTDTLATRTVASWITSGAGAEDTKYEIFALFGGSLQKVFQASQYSIAAPSGNATSPGITFLADPSSGLVNYGGAIGLVVSSTQSLQLGPNTFAFGVGNAPVAAGTVGATLTNSVTVGGTTNVIDNVVAADVDTTAAALVTTRNALYQVTLKLRAIEAALKANGIIVI
jgi:hypothetical protein